MDDDIYKTPNSNLLVEEGASQETATRMRRLVASIFDSIVMLAVIVPLMYFSGGFDFINTGVKSSWVYTLTMGGIGLLVFILINGSLLVNHGQTLGKKVMGIRIVDIHGNLPSIQSHLIPRYVTYFGLGYVPGLGTILSLVNVLFIFGKQKRCLHDLVAKTKVING